MDTWSCPQMLGIEMFDCAHTDFKSRELYPSPKAGILAPVCKVTLISYSNEEQVSFHKRARHHHLRTNALGLIFTLQSAHIMFLTQSL